MYVCMYTSAYAQQIPVVLISVRYIHFHTELMIILVSIVPFSPFNQKNPYLAPVIVNRELHKGGDRSCMHIEFDITDSKLKYTAGDHVAILADNDPELIEKIGKLLDVDLETVFTLVNNDGEPWLL